MLPYLMDNQPRLLFFLKHRLDHVSHHYYKPFSGSQEKFQISFPSPQGPS